MFNDLIAKVEAHTHAVSPIPTVISWLALLISAIALLFTGINSFRLKKYQDNHLKVQTSSLEVTTTVALRTLRTANQLDEKTLFTACDLTLQLALNNLQEVKTTSLKTTFKDVREGLEEFKSKIRGGSNGNVPNLLESLMNEIGIFEAPSEENDHRAVAYGNLKKIIEAIKEEWKLSVQIEYQRIQSNVEGQK